MSKATTTNVSSSEKSLDSVKEEKQVIIHDLDKKKKPYRRATIIPTSIDGISKFKNKDGI